jgi:tagatose-6-phosphate ketose/aldose isomerase
MLVLPEETNDRGLAMTSSFSSMVAAGICLATINNLDETAKIIENLAKAAEKVMEKYSGSINDICQADFTRAVFLGSNTLTGCATECHLKLQEMSSGKVVAKHDSFMGLRHGPEAVIDDKTVVVYLLSEDGFIRKYEMDLINGVHRKKIGQKKVAVCKKSDSELSSLCDLVIEHGVEGIPDDYLTPLYVTIGQMMGLFKSLYFNLKPDAPSEAGIISRVVQGVKIYDRPIYMSKNEFRVIAG